jgi:hypothetical protein
LNPLSFFTTQTTTTTLNPLEQQRIDEQRRFQEEIANKGLREQQQRSFGLRTTSTTTTTTTQPPDPFSFDDLQSNANPFLDQSDSAAFQQNTESGLPDALLELTRPQPARGRFPPNQPAPAQSYSFVRTFRRRRAIDGQPSAANEVADQSVSSTANPQQVLVNTLLRDTNPREDLAKIGGWLFDNLAKTVERNIAHFAEATARPRSVAQQSAVASTFFPAAYRSTPRPLKIVPVSTSPSDYLAPEYHSSPKPLQHFFAAQPSTSPTVDEYPTTAKPVQTLVPVESLQEYYQSTARPVKQLFVPPELPVANPLPITYAQTTPKIDLNQFGWNIAAPSPYEVPVWRPSPQDLVVQSPRIETVTYPTSTTTRAPSVALPLMVVPQSATTFLPKIRNVQIVPVPGQEGLNYDFGQQTTPRSVETTRVYVQPNTVTSTENEASITSLFKARLNSLKDDEIQRFDLLPHQLNTTDSGSSTPLYSTVSSVTPSTAIFVKMPEDDPSSTAGYIFDRTISAKHKKESHYAASKKNNRSPQMLKSTLVYRTPPGKRATLTRSELAKNEQMEAGLLAHILEAQGKPLSSWMAGQTSPVIRQTTTGRPFVSALMNLMRKRSS